MVQEMLPVNIVEIKTAPQSRRIVINFETGKGPVSNLMTSELHTYVRSAIIDWIVENNSRSQKGWNYGRPRIELRLDTSS